LPTIKDGEHAHLLMVDKSIKEIKEDYVGSKKIIPLVIFTIKYGEKGYVKVQPGRLDKIELSSMKKDFFVVFHSLQEVLHGI
jgi:ribosome assembly protein YihI (activator of Der GTPase)